MWSCLRSCSGRPLISPLHGGEGQRHINNFNMWPLGPAAPSSWRVAGGGGGQAGKAAPAMPSAPALPGLGSGQVEGPQRWALAPAPLAPSAGAGKMKAAADFTDPVGTRLEGGGDGSPVRGD